MSEDGNESSPQRPKRKIKKVLVLSSSASDSDDSVGPSRTRKRRLRVLSDEDSGESSGSSVVRPGTRRRRALPKLRDPDDSDTSGWATDHSDAPQPTTSDVKPTSGFASDSSEGNSDKCSICLLRFTNQEVGTPQTCEHIFCLDCITEWSKNVNTCPVDRMTFDSIVVRACAGGRVLRTEPVRVLERRPSVDILVVEDLTVCEICGNSDNEEAMLLCDSCDLGYHMQCLTPPLTEVPLDQWFCPNCQNSDLDLEALEDIIYLDEMGDLFSDIDFDLPLGARPSALRQARNLRRSTRTQLASEPSTSSGRTHRATITTAAQGSRRNATVVAPRSRRRTAPHRRKRRRTQTVIIEYELTGQGKFPVTQRVKKTIKRRKVKKRSPRTAARRSHVRASVRARLSAAEQPRTVLSAAPASLALRRHRAGVPALSLFGNPNQLEYFSEDDNEVSEGASTAVAARPAATSIFNAHRQARRKMVTIPSPPHASSAPDILSGILESQTLLHSKKSVVSISVDGHVNIKLQTESVGSRNTEADKKKKDDRLDLSKGEDAAKKVPSYPGQSRGGRGWGGGYNGNYPRDHGAGFSRGQNYDNNYQSRQQGNSFHNNHQNPRRDDGDAYFSRRSHYHDDPPPYDRQRRPPESNRNSYPPRNNEQNRPNYNSWQSVMGGPRADPPQQARHSFGGFENPLDMRMGQTPQQAPVTAAPVSMYPGTEAPRQDEPGQSYRPLPEPPVFKYDKMPEVDKSEDEKSDSGLVIDTEKYDPTEPTNDDDSGDEHRSADLPPTTLTSSALHTRPSTVPSASAASLAPGPAASLAPGPAASLAPGTAASLAPGPAASLTPASAVTQASAVSTVSAAPAAVQSILAGIDTNAINVPATVLDSAVRQVLAEHAGLLGASPASRSAPRSLSDDDSDGDCPNFSIYSATSVHIANTSSMAEDRSLEVPEPKEDDIQDDIPEEPVTPTSDRAESPGVPVAPKLKNEASDGTDHEYNQKVSKRCPITTNTRNPIKIKLNTPTLIKKQKLSLYDDDDFEDQIESVDRTDSSETVTSPLKSTHKRSPSTDCIENMKKLDSFDNKDKSERFKSPVNADKKTCDADKRNPEPTSNDNPTSVAADNGRQDDEKDSKDITTPEKKHSLESEKEMTDDDNELSDTEVELQSQTSKKDDVDQNEEAIEKMTESISETEDERSYTPCLDENKSKDTSQETDRDKGIEGLDTEMISEEEANDIFSDNDKGVSDKSATSPQEDAPAPRDVTAVTADNHDKSVEREDSKRKKKKESKKESKEKVKSKSKKSEIAFKKLSKNGKERNYRDKDKEKSKKDRRDSSTEKDRQKRRKEKRKDLERYDVRTVVTEKRKKTKDPFGRDISPRARSSRSPSRSPPARASSPRRRSASPRRRSASPRRRSVSPRRRSASPRRRSASRGRASPPRVRGSPPRPRRSISRARASPPRTRRSTSRVRRSLSARMRRSISRSRRSLSRVRRSISRVRRSISRERRSLSKNRVSASRRRSLSRVRGASPARKRARSRSPSRTSPASPRRRRASPSPRRRRSPSPRVRVTKKKKRSRSRRRESPRKKSPKRKKQKRRSASRPPVAASPARAPAASWSPPSVDSRLLSPRTPPPDTSPPRRLRVVLNNEDKRKRKEKRRRRDPERVRHKRPRDSAGPSKEVFTSGDNILVSVSFKEQERTGEDPDERKRRRAEAKRERRRRRAAAATVDAPTKPVAIIDLERSPFRELTPSPKNVIVLSDSDRGEEEPAAPTAAPEPAALAPPVGPKTPPEPAAPTVKFTLPPKPTAPRAPNPLREQEPAPAPEAAVTPAPEPEPAPAPNSPDAYDPFEPTRSASASPTPAPSPPRAAITLEAAQKTNMSADEVIDRRPLSPMEKVLALLQSTRDVSPEPPPGSASPAAAAPPAPAPPPQAPATRIVLPEPTRSQPPKLFLAKPSPIKSTPIKPLQSTQKTKPAVSRLPLPPSPAGGGSDYGGDSPYSPGSSDFGDVFEPPGAGGAGGRSNGGRRDVFDSLFGAPPVGKRKKDRSSAAKVPVKLNKKKGKTQVGVKIDDDNLKILDDLPSSAVEMQVKSKFLKKLNRQERVVEEVKLVLKPHYNKKRVTKDEYKDILRRAVPKICHNKTGEINPAKIQALVEAYVKRLRKKHKLGLA